MFVSLSDQIRHLFLYLEKNLKSMQEANMLRIIPTYLFK